MSRLRSLLLLAVGLVMILASVGLFALYSRASAEPRPRDVAAVWRQGPLAITVSYDEGLDEATLMLLENGRVRARLVDAGFTANLEPLVERRGFLGRDGALPAIGTDVDQDGRGDVVIQGWSGGAHCCYTYDVFTLAPGWPRLAQAEVGDAGEFVDVDGDGRLEIRTWDWDFSSYGETSFADGVAPALILALGPRGYELAPTMMLASPPPPAELARRVGAIADPARWTGNRPPADFWREILALLYSGNEAAAWRLFDDAWAAAVPDREAARQELSQALARNPNWPRIRAAASSRPR